MNWEESRALTSLKRDFLRTFSAARTPFYLTGGSALGIFYLGHRLSYDLDFFTTQDVEWHLIRNAILATAKDIGADCRSVTASPHFHRFELTRDYDKEILDFVLEMAPQVDQEKNIFDGIRVDTLREIMASKICTLINRCELKDVVDLYFLSKNGFGVVDHFADAQQKEGGLDPAMMSFLLDRLQIDAVPDYLLEPVTVDDLRRFVRDLKETLASMSFPENQSG